MSKTKKLGRGLKALLGDAVEKDIVELEIALIDNNPDQPRKVFEKESLENLAKSIKKYGIVQPVAVRKKENERYELIAGERRLRAAKIANLTKIPVIVKEYDDRESAEIALVENLQREDLNAIEEAKAYDEIIKKHEITQEEMAKIVGKSRSYITNLLRLLQLPQSIQKLLEEKKLTIGQARPLLTLESVAEKLKLAKRILEEGLSARQIEKLLKEKSEKGEKTKEDLQVSTYLKSLEEELLMSLGSHVKIKIGKGRNAQKGTITISFKNEEEFTRITKLLKKDGR